ncbi:MAG: threonine/serine dehydratase [Acidobacteria bacterium]|nr:threonine/serine dehydratase [Acidobacteriota bacterium]
MTAPSIADLLRARQRLGGRVIRTPLVQSSWLAKIASGRVFLKLESLQTTGSFKLRGALNATLALLEQRRSSAECRNLVTASAGNHGHALASAAKELRLHATIFTPKNAPRVKLDAIRALGATLRDEANGYEAAERLAKAYAAETGASFISPYNDPDVIAGAGTVAIEIVEDLPELDALVVPVGGGGLISGVATALKTMAPAVEVIGVEAEASPAFHMSLKAGRIVEVDVKPTIADGLAGNMDADSMTFDIVRRLVDHMLLVTEDEMKASIHDLLSQEHIIAEGAGAAALAAVLAGKVPTAGRCVAVVVSGANIDAERLKEIVAA